MILVGLTSQPHRTRSRTQWVQKWSKLSCQHLKPIQECRTQFSFSRISILDVFLSKACLSRSFLTGKLKTLVLLGFIFTIFLVNALCFLHGTHLFLYVLKNQILMWFWFGKDGWKSRNIRGKLQNFLIFREICSLASLEEWLTLCFFPFKGDGRGLMGLVSFQESPNYLLTWIS